MSAGKRSLGVVALLVIGLIATAGCGQTTSESKGEPGSTSEGGSASGGGTTSGGGGSASGGGSTSDKEVTEDTAPGEAARSASGSFRGVVASYEVAQSEIDDEGGEQEVGEYRVGYIVEPAEGWWEGAPENLAWREPAAGETNHIEILPFEQETGLLVPGAEITLTVLDEAGEVVESKPLEFYRGEFYHYANNFSLPGSGTYALRAEIEPPTFLRHGTKDGEGRVLTEPVVVEFETVEIDTEEG